MSVSETKLIESSWESKGDECYPAWKLQRNFLDIDDLLKDMEEIVQEAGLGSIGYRSQESEINEISQDMLHLNAYIRSAIPELEDRLDKPLCKHFNQNATESISRINLDEYTTENKLGMKRWELRTGPGGLPVRRLMDAPTLTMEDFMGLTTLEEQADRSLVGMPKAFSDFTEMFAVDYNLLKEQLTKENGKEVTLEDYLLNIRDAGKFDHKMNKPVQEFLSVVLDATIVKPLIESVTGEDMITGEDLSDFEREMKIVSGVVSLFTLGQGGVVVSSGRVAMQSTLATMGKMVAIDMITTGVTYGTSEICQQMGVPGEITMLLSMLAGGTTGSKLNNKWLANVSAEDAKKYGLWNYLRENGLDQNKVNDIILTNKGLRPDTKSYLKNQYIIAHLQKFDDGASIIMTKEQYILYVKGKDYIGIPNDGTQFILPQNLCDELVYRNGNNISSYEEALGFDSGHFEDGGGLIRIDINNVQDLNLRIPTGNEYGANSRWIPGGYTEGGIPEAISDLIPNRSDNIKVTEVNK